MHKETKSLRVNGMSSVHCENFIRRAVGILAGVDSVYVDFRKRKVDVEFDPTMVSLAAIAEAIREQGYDIQ
jgi:copper chaperone